ncbi:DNA topoisomerase 1 [Camellia lanceoleosa]|uniref:DNA topoisomerase 1 n=1 Tax=Camellia lanceoleosa TaxID=1840588 RepID=A0ACC0HGJ2_9ERIC|nr:DNA topoisomerase 1 [Camellia lanceoleosa]
MLLSICYMGCNLVVQRDNKRFLFLDMLTLECPGEPQDYIQGIRAAYTKDFANDDEADTVGCCTLKVENVEPMPPNILKFDFLGKDSIRYQNEVEVELPVFKAIQ